MKEKVTRQVVMPFAGKLRDILIDLPLVLVLEQPSVFLNLLQTRIDVLDEDISRLMWPEVKQDAGIYYEVFRQFSETADTTDEEFFNHFLESISPNLMQAQIFKSLASDKIILSKAHRAEGSSSQKHILNVIKQITTDFLLANERFLLRVFALMHDNGKMLVAGYEGDTTDLIASVGKANDDGSINSSFINHQLLSVLILQSLFDHEASFGNLIGTKDSAYLLSLIEHHHDFGELNRISAEPVTFDLEKYFSRMPELAAQDRWRYLLHSFLFTMADIAATKGHWHYLSENIERFEDLVDFYSQQHEQADFDFNFLALCRQSISLTREKYADIIADCEQK